MKSSSDMPKAYDASLVEDRIYAAWEASGVFNPDNLPERNQAGAPYCIMMPPPNRTGTLHMGHASMLAIEDLLIRFHRMLGERALWIPGTDHASIATETKVEQMLIKDGMKDPKKELGREVFLQRVVDFAEQSKNIINNQVRKMGSSCDWSRERYTFDADRNQAVNEVFRMMFEDGLIERGDYIVNWDPKNQTVVSDDEIEWVEEKAPFYFLQYGPFVIGTSRPETKFGDKYVVMHPEDERYAEYQDGQKLTLEWINGPCVATVIKDAVIDREFGSGVMTITPWHDMVDFELAQRRGLDREQVIGYDGRMLPMTGEFAGLPIAEARKKVVEKLAAKGLVVKIDEQYVHRVATSYRGGGMIEPQIKRQWFIRVNKPFSLRQDTLGKWKKGESSTLKELMQFAVESKLTKIIPERFEKIYFHWVNNLRDWCISRQIWFGHRIPVWYREEEVQCSVESPGEGWQQDPDSLDTWFSSGMWTFSALGWPNQKAWEEHRDYHPTAVLETGYDIIFFWVARMVLMSTYAIGEVPFKDTYLHGLVRDEQGRKMSKSLGNIINPLDMIPKYGTDAVRLSLVVGATPGQDIKLSESKIEGYRNFTNKLWNISRFILIQLDSQETSIPPLCERGTRSTRAPSLSRRGWGSLSDHWITSRLNATVKSVTAKLSRYELSSAGEELRDFTWGDLADWYLEIAKIEGGKGVLLKKILETVLKLWHPFMPFVTESIWQTAGFEGQLIVAPWPEETPVETSQDLSEFEALREVITGLRRLRTEAKVEPAKKTDLFISNFSHLKTHELIILTLARGSSIQFVDQIPNGFPATAVGAGMVGIDLAGVIDIEAERLKVEKEIEKTEAYISSLKVKLGNTEFLAKAPPKVREEMEKKLAEATAALEGLRSRK